MEHGWGKPNPVAIERLERVTNGTRLLRQSLGELWDELPSPSSKRIIEE